jgi:hypothetical protein
MSARILSHALPIILLTTLGSTEVLAFDLYNATIRNVGGDTNLIEVSVSNIGTKELTNLNVSFIARDGTSCGGAACADVLLPAPLPPGTSTIISCFMPADAPPIGCGSDIRVTVTGKGSKAEVRAAAAYYGGSGDNFVTPLE